MRNPRHREGHSCNQVFIEPQIVGDVGKGEAVVPAPV